MKAMILAAGKGTRLKPLTDNTPKALVRVKGLALLEHVIMHLKKYAYTDIIINTHYLGEQIAEFLKSKNNFGLHIEISDESSLLLETGGGLVHASHFFNDCEHFLLHNVDILSDINLDDMLRHHRKEKAVATLAVRKRPTKRYLLFDSDGKLSGWKNTESNESVILKPESQPLTEMAFSGIHILSPEIIKHFNKGGAFSITPEYLRLAPLMPIVAYNHTHTQWYDIGKHQTLADAEKHFLTHN